MDEKMVRLLPNQFRMALSNLVNPAELYACGIFGEAWIFFRQNIRELFLAITKSIQSVRLSSHI